MEATITYENEKPVKAEGFLKIAAVLKPGYIESLDLSKYELTYEMLFTLCLHLSEGIQVKQLNIGNNKRLEAAAYEKVVEIIQKTKVTSLVLANFDLNKEKLQVLQKSLKRKKIKLEVLAISENKEMKASDFQIVAELFQNARTDCLVLIDCDLTSEKLSAFLQYAEGRNVKVSKLEIGKNKSMKPEAYSKLAEFIQQMKVEQLWMKDCALDKDKLKAFHDALRGRHVQLSHLYLHENKTMEAEEFEQIVGLCQLANVETLSLTNCDLNHKKLASFNKHLSGKNVKIPCLKLGKNRKMESAAYREVAEIVVRANVADLWLDDCNLDEEKLDKFCKSLEGKNIRLSSLMLNENKSIMPQGFRCIGEILQVMEIETLGLRDCALTVDKLRSFREGLGTKVHIYRLDLSSNRYMEAACYCEIVRCVEAAKVAGLSLENCDLNEKKLDIFQSSFKGRNIELVTLVLDRNKSITPEGFQYIAKTLQVASNIENLCLQDCALTADKLRSLHEVLAENVKITGLSVSNNRQMGAACYLEVVHFIEKAKVDKLWMNNCNLDERKLSVFQSSLKGKNIKMEYLILNQNGSIEPAGFKHIAEAFVNADIEGLGLRDCELTLKKLQAFNSSLQGKDVKISKLDLSDNKHMEPAAYGEVATLIQRAKVDMLWLNRCNLNKEKLSAFQKGLKEGSVEMHQLSLDGNKAIEPDGFCCLADIFSVAQIQALSLRDCDLTSQQLKIFGERIREMNVKVKMKGLLLNRNKAIEPEGFEYIADICWNMGVGELHLKNCALTPAKLSTFSKHIHEKNAKIPKLGLSQNKDMEPDTYHELADVVQAAQVDSLRLHNCNLNSEKLEAFAKGLKARNVKVPKLSLEENKAMESEAYHELAGIIEAAQVEYLWLENCDLNEEKLQAFQKGFEGKNIQVSELNITNNKGIDPDCEEVKDILRELKVINFLSDKDKKSSHKTTKQGSRQDRGIVMAYTEDISISRSFEIDREFESADSGRASSIQSSEQGKKRVSHWLDEHEDLLSKEETVARKALELAEKSHLGHAAELGDLVSLSKDQELSCDELISISKDQIEKSAAFILTECVAKVLPSELGAQHGAVSEKLLFIENALDELSDDLRLQLLVNCSPDIYQVYLALGKYKEAVGICQRGISLIQEKTGPNNQYFGILGKLEHNIGFAYACQHNMVAARGHYLQALDHYNEAKKMGEDCEEEEAKKLLESRLNEVEKSLCSWLPFANHHGVQAFVGKSGGSITFEDCIVNFPEGSMPSDTNIYMFLDENMVDFPDGVIPITPAIKITPCITLQRDATVKIKTWCSSSNGGNAYVYFKKMEESEWQRVQTLTLGKQMWLEFEISEFCTYCGAIDEVVDDGKEFAIESCLFYNANGKLANRIIQECGVGRKKLTEDLSSRGFMQACSSDMKFMVNINDVFKVTLTPVPTTESEFGRQEFETALTAKFFRGFGKTKDLLLPKECKGTYDFTHRVQILTPSRDPKDDDDHVDRIVLGPGFSQPTINYTVAGFYAANGSTITTNMENCTTGASGGLPPSSQS